MVTMTLIWLAYLGLASGLMVFGALLVWLGIRASARPVGAVLRSVFALAALVAVAGAAAAAVLESRIAGP